MKIPVLIMDLAIAEHVCRELDSEMPLRSYKRELHGTKTSHQEYI